MPNEQKNQPERTLEMRLAELEDKLAKMHVTEDELKAYEKVSALMGQLTPGATPAGAGTAADLTLRCIVQQRCIIYRCIINTRCTIITRCTIECYECSCGPCSPTSFGSPAGGFNQLGF